MTTNQEMASAVGESEAATTSDNTTATHIIGGVVADAKVSEGKTTSGEVEGYPTGNESPASADATNGINGEKVPSSDKQEMTTLTDLSKDCAITTPTSETKTMKMSETKHNTTSSKDGGASGDISELDDNNNRSNNNPLENTTPTSNTIVANPCDDDATGETIEEEGETIAEPSNTVAKNDAAQHPPNQIPNTHSKENAPPQAGAPPLTSKSAAPPHHSSNQMMEFDDEYSDSNDTLLTMSFNQDGGCLAIGTGSGFRICNVHPYQETFRRNLGGGVGGSNAIEGAGIAHIEMLYRTNLLALTGHSNSPIYPPNKVFLYDDHLQRPIGELSFRQKVLTTKLRRDRIVIVLRDRVYIYNFSDLALLDKVHTGDNPLGLVGMSTDNGGVGGSTTGNVTRADVALGNNHNSQQRNNGLVLACPSTQRGQVRVELYGLRRTTFVNAHESALGALTLSVDGSLLATASERGTVIRLFDTRGVAIGGGCVGGNVTSEKTTNAPTVSSSIPLREFRRGVERATISCLTFSLDSRWLGCASNHGTVHIFEAYDPDGKDVSAAAEAAKLQSKPSSMTGKAMRMLPRLVTSPKQFLVDGVQSYAQVRGVPHPHACAFVPDREQTVAVAGMDNFGNGCLLLAEFGNLSHNSRSGGGGGDTRGESIKAAPVSSDDSEAKRIGYHRFFKYKSPVSEYASTGSTRRRTKGSTSRDGSSKAALSEAALEGGAYIDDSPVDTRMNHISIGDENEDDFVPIDYNG